MWRLRSAGATERDRLQARYRKLDRFDFTLEFGFALLQLQKLDLADDAAVLERLLDLDFLFHQFQLFRELFLLGTGFKEKPFRAQR